MTFGSEITSAEDVLRHMGQIFIGNHCFRLNQRHCPASLYYNPQVICTQLRAIAYVTIYHHRTLTVLTGDLPNSVHSSGGESGIKSDSDSDTFHPLTV